MRYPQLKPGTRVRVLKSIEENRELGYARWIKVGMEGMVIAHTPNPAPIIVRFENGKGKHRRDAFWPEELEVI